MFFIRRPPSRTKLGSILQLCAKRIRFSRAQSLLQRCFSGHPVTDSKSLNILLTKYMRSGCVEEARRLFDEAASRNTVSWNSMIRGYFMNNRFDEAVELFDLMTGRDLFTHNTMIAGLMQHGDIAGAESLFAQMPVKDIVSWNSMIVGYVHNDLVDEALRVFNQMPERNVISWNTVMVGLMKFSLYDVAEQLFDEMPERDVASWTAMVSGLASQGRIVEARSLFDEMPERDVRAWNTILGGYIKNQRVEISEGLFVKMPEKDSESWSELIDGLIGCGRLVDAWKYFIDMPEKNARSWNAILLGFIRSGFVEEAHGLFEKNPLKDVVSWTNMVIGYFELGEVTSSCMLFEMIPEKDETLYNATIFGLGENNHGEEGLKLFMKMKERRHLNPDEATFTSVLNICSVLPSLHFGKQTHGLVVKMGFDSFVAVCNAITTMYARCGSVDSALTGFRCTGNPDIISWNSVICGLSHNGRGWDALKLFREMRLTDIKPDEVTFVGVLSACSHTGMINQGLYCYHFMKYKCLVKPACEHYTCIVDLLGKFGFVEEAVQFIDQMRADRIEVRASIWGSLLAACRNNGNVKIGVMAGWEVLRMEPQNAGAYVILAEIYMSAGKKRDAEKVWSSMKERAVKKQPGCSWIEVKNSVHVFLAGDESHSEVDNVYTVLSLLSTDVELNKMDEGEIDSP